MITMSKTQTIQNLVNELWTVPELTRRFRVTAQTIHLWRANRGLPAIVIPGDRRPSVRFVPGEVEGWASGNGVTMYPPRARRRRRIKTGFNTQHSPRRREVTANVAA